MGKRPHPGGPPERVITEYAQAVNANYIMFGLHHDGHSSSYFRKSLVAKTIKDASCAVFAFAQRAVQKGCESTHRPSAELTQPRYDCLSLFGAKGGNTAELELKDVVLTNAVIKRLVLFG